MANLVRQIVRPPFGPLVAGPLTLRKGGGAAPPGYAFLIYKDGGGNYRQLTYRDADGRYQPLAYKKEA